MIFRVRAAAIILDKSMRLLMVHHRQPQTGVEWWTLPGGGLEKDESAVSAVKREVKEECNIECIPGKLVYVREFIQEEINTHHVELFFTASVVDIDNYKIKKGVDPELKEQIITRVGFLSKEEIQKTKVKVYPEVLRGRFWEDLKNNFKDHEVYLGLRE